MDRQLFQDVPLAERRQYLKDNSFKIDPMYTYTRELEESELQDRKNELSQNIIKIDKAEQVLKGHKETFNAETKPLKEINKEYLQQIRTRSEEVCGEVFMIKDEHNGQMGYYSPEGILLFQRSLLPEERQFSIVDNFRQAQ